MLPLLRGENTAAGAVSEGGGGAIISTSGSGITIINSTLAQNRASAGRGGAILSITSGANITIYNSTIANNTAADVGGGIAGNVTSTAVNPFYLDVLSSIIAQNSAASNSDVYQQTTTPGRPEQRRVGKECRPRWPPDH